MPAPKNPTQPVQPDVPEAHIVLKGKLLVEIKGQRVVNSVVNLDITASDFAAMLKAVTPELVSLVEQVEAKVKKPKTPESEEEEKDLVFKFFSNR